MWTFFPMGKSLTKDAIEMRSGKCRIQYFRGLLRLYKGLKSEIFQALLLHFFFKSVFCESLNFMKVKYHTTGVAL